MKSAKELADEIANTLFECTKNRVEDSSPSTCDEGIPYEEEINPTVLVTKSEVRDITERKVVRMGFLDEVAEHLVDRDIDVKILKDGTLKCKGNFFQTTPAQYNSLSSVKESNAFSRELNEDDEN